MKRSKPFMVVMGIAFALASAGRGSAQQPAPATPTAASEVDREVTSIEKLVLDAAEAMPEEKYNFSPESLKLAGSDYKGVRTFATELKHIAASNYFIWTGVTGDKVPDGLQSNGSDTMKSKAEIIQFVRESFALGHRAAGTLTAGNIVEPIRNGKTTRLYLATFGVAHAYDHYGQMIEYLRMNGITPPASRPKS